MRLFIAVPFSEDFRQTLFSDTQELKKLQSRGSLSRTENLHLTLAFLGEIGEERIAKIRAAMDACRTGAFPLTVGRPGRFHYREGDTLYRAVDGGEPLLQLQSSLTEALRERGFALEERAFKPHITVARRAQLSEGVTMEMLNECSPKRCTTASEMTLFLSERKNGVLTYTPIYTVNLHR